MKTAKLRVLHLDLAAGAAGSAEPRDRRLYEMAVRYCEENLANAPALLRFNDVWIAAEVDEDENPIKVHGITGWQWRVDIPFFRATGDHARAATKLLNDRLQSFFGDRGLRGEDVLLYISEKEKPEQRCPAWEESLHAAGAVRAERLAVRVR